MTPISTKIKLVTIDGDGCLFAYTNIGSAFHSSWDAVAFAYGLKETWDERSRKYYDSHDKSSQWAEEDAADLRGRPLRQAEAVLYPIPYSPGAREFLQASKGRLVRGLLSACLDLVGQKAAAETAMDFCYCNIMHVENGVFSGTHDLAVSPWEKHLLLPDICRQYGVAPKKSATSAITPTTSRYSSGSACRWPSGPSCRKCKREPNMLLTISRNWGGYSACPDNLFPIRRLNFMKKAGTADGRRFLRKASSVLAVLGTRHRGFEGHSFRSRGNAVGQAHVPAAFAVIHPHLDGGLTRRMVASGMDDDVIGSHLGNRDGGSVEPQVHFNDGRMSAVTGRFHYVG